MIVYLIESLFVCLLFGYLLHLYLEYTVAGGDY